MQNFQENLPGQNTIQYIEKQIQEHKLPVHKSGLELAATIINIASSAKLILKENLNHTPSIFEKNNFEEQRFTLINSNQKAKETSLAQLSLSLSGKYKSNLEYYIENFLYDFKMHFMGNTCNAEQDKVKEVDTEYLIFEETLYELIQPETDIQNAYETYVDLKDFLTSIGVEKETFEKMGELIDKENEIRYTMH